ncbi:MAG: 4Fe-4S dicluster domain-containing protein, partial [Candidatus Palauibacterales bacterium]|nr:4Fe-4S dicluster domain-containing protein [Candidatus Palauibacterales bacterium]
MKTDADSQEPAEAGDEARPDGAPSTNGGPREAAPSSNGGSGGGTSRRDFLKVIGVSSAGAAAAGCGPPDAGDKLIPKLVQDPDQVPGENTRFASVLASAGPEPVPIHAITRDGRVLNLERNPNDPGPGAGVSPLALSALQDLYDPDRISSPRQGPVADGGGSELGWDEALTAAGEAVSGGSTVLLTSATPGTADQFHAEWADAVGAEHVRYESFGYAPLREAHRLVFGRGEVPQYAVDRADHVVSFGADFQETWLAPTELEDRFADARDIDAGRFAKLTFVAPRLSRTGTNADEWLPARGGTEALVALAAANVVAGQTAGVDPDVASLLSGYAPEDVAERTGVSAGEIRALGEELAAADAPVALPPGTSGQGTSATDAHVAVALLNQVTGAVGETVLFGRGPARPASATYDEMADLAERMSAGEVSTLVVAGPNPAYTLPAASGFAEALGNVETVISLNSHPDETTVAADLVLPSHHDLEAWGDVRLRPGSRALRQPVTRPIWETRQAEDILMQVASTAGAGADFGADDYRGYLRNRWRQLHGQSGSAAPFTSWWRERLKEGGLFAPEPPAGEAPDVASDRLGSYQPPEFGAVSGEMAMVAYPTGQFYDGRGANRSWMQELPDPVTKVVWSSWVELHPETAGPLGLENGDVVEVTADGGTIRAPVYVYEGVRPDTVGIPIGQGHTAYGRNAEGRGVDPRDLLPGDTDARTGALAFAGTAVEVTATGQTEQLVVTQGSDTDHGREIAELMGQEEAEKAVESHEVDLTELVEAAYDSDPDSPYRWGMTIDLNACSGCGACVTACYAENNLPTVGEERAGAGREMSWLRVERYFEETADGGFQTVHEPMMCQHCGDAPCEPVCPVYATYHNPEGLNVQVYNRCIGTRYCSNNCPYKVRRFNWFGYEFPYPLNLQLNPDVTVREKGVMEKCTFCVQRINRAKIDAKEEGRLVEDGEVETACQVACPTDAITFGNLKDPSSRVSRIA